MKGSIGANAVPRCCGEKRVQGGVYIENGGGCTPFEHFLFCPSLPITDEMGITDIGTSIFNIPNNDTPHVADMIGQKFYPFPVYWIEETKRHGLSRRVTKQIASKLTRDSMIFICHRKAYSVVFDMYPHSFSCPKHKPEHKNQLDIDMCISFFWEDVDKTSTMKPFRDGDKVNGVQYNNKYYVKGAKQALVTLPSVQFVCHLRDKKVKPDYHKNGAFFAAFPITRLVVVKAEDGSHEETLDELRNTPNLLVDELKK